MASTTTRFLVGAGLALAAASCSTSGSDVLATGWKPMALAVHGATIYWTDSGDGTVRAVPAAGGANVVLASRQAQPTGIAVDDTAIYWTNQGDGTVQSVPLAGGDPVTLATGQNLPVAIAVRDRTIYWVNEGHGDRPDGSIMALALDGGDPVTLVPSQDGPTSIAVDADHVYWTSLTDNQVRKVARTGGDAVAVGGSGFPWAIAVDAHGVYWTDGYGELNAAPIDGVGGSSLAPGHYQRAGGLVVSGGEIFWTVADGEVLRIATAGGTVTTLSKDESVPVAVDTDVDWVYFLCQGDGTLRRLPRPQVL
jgi:hypothetical protein